jgi:hypothetical protein
MHEVAEKSAVLDGAGEDSLSGLVTATISNHGPKILAEGFKTGTKETCDPGSRPCAVNMERVVIDDFFSPRVIFHTT